MRDDKPDTLEGYVFRRTLVAKVSVYQSKEDAHGGPGYYPREVVVAQSEEPVDARNLTKILNFK